MLSGSNLVLSPFFGLAANKTGVLVVTLPPSTIASGTSWVSSAVLSWVDKSFPRVSRKWASSITAIPPGPTEAKTPGTITLLSPDENNSFFVDIPPTIPGMVALSAEMYREAGESPKAQRAITVFPVPGSPNIATWISGRCASRDPPACCKMSACLT